MASKTEQSRGGLDGVLKSGWILPRRLRRQCGASVVTAAIVVANRMEDPVKLTDTQLLLLPPASHPNDRALEPPPKPTAAPAAQAAPTTLPPRSAQECRAPGRAPHCASA